MKELTHLAEFIEQFHINDYDEAISAAASFCILDTISAAIGALDDPLMQKVREIYDRYEPDGSEQSASIWGTERTTTLRKAVFFNAMYGHTLELDDVHTGSKTHIGTVVIPAAWALAEFLGASGSELLEAVICGYETAARIGMAIGVSSHRNKGWHAIGTIGVFGAAGACAKLLHFDAKQILAAFGLAGTQACSTWAFLTGGANNKVLHPGRAAVSGLEACMLVQSGMYGSADILDSTDGGLFTMMSDDYDQSLIDRDLGTVFEIFNVDKKPYPCCRSTHCAIDAALKLSSIHKIHPQHILSVSVHTYLVGVKQCGLAQSSLDPQRASEAKFSTPYTVACALVNGRVSLEDFETDALRREDVRCLMRLVTVSEDAAFTAQYPKHWGCEMVITMNDGTEYRETISDASGSVDNPLTTAQLTEKIKSCCCHCDPDWLHALQEQLLQLRSLQTLPKLFP